MTFDLAPARRIRRSRSRALPAPVAVALASVALAACSGSDDPREAQLFDVLRNTTDGTYSERLEERRKRNEAAGQANDAISASNDALEAQRAELAPRVSAARSRVSSLNRRIDRAKAGLDESDARYARLVKAEQELARATRRLDVAEDSGRSTDLSEALRRISLTEEELAF